MPAPSRDPPGRARFHLQPGDEDRELDVRGRCCTGVPRRAPRHACYSAGAMSGAVRLQESGKAVARGIRTSSEESPGVPLRLHQKIVLQSRFMLTTVMPYSFALSSA